MSVRRVIPHSSQTKLAPNSAALRLVISVARGLDGPHQTWASTGPTAYNLGIDDRLESTSVPNVARSQNRFDFLIPVAKPFRAFAPATERGPAQRLLRP